METQRAHEVNHKETVLELVRGIFHDVRNLSTQELTAAKLETKQELGKIAKASVSLGIGAFILALGVVFLSLMGALLLQQYAGWPLWAGVGAIGLTYALIGAIIILVAKDKAGTAKPIPERTLRSAKEDLQYISGKATGR